MLSSRLLQLVIDSKKIRDNYSKPTWGLARFHFAYPWYKTYHFAPLYFNPLPPRCPPDLQTLV